MNILLDACTPRPLRKFLPGHSVSTAQEMGWGALKNGDLLRQAEGQFEAFISNEGHSLSMLQRIAAALGQCVEIQFLAPEKATHGRRPNSAILEPVT